MAKTANQNKKWWYIAGGIVAMLVVVSLSFNNIARGAIETMASKTMGTEVTIGSVKIAPWSQSVTVTDLSVANPEGFEEATFLTVPSISVAASSLFGDTIVIDDINVDQMTVTYELNESGRTNTSVIQDNLKRSAQRSKAPSATQPIEEQQKTQAAKQVVIRNLQITNATVIPAISLAGESSKAEVSLPTITMKDLGSTENTLQAPEALRRVMGEITQTVASNVSSDTFRGLTDKIGEKLESLFN